MKRESYMLIKIKNLDYSYGKKQVLKNIEFNINSNEITAILGHNGAGKTTLFKLISGLIKIKNKEIEFNSKYLNSRSQIAFVPESGGFFQDLSVLENLRFRYLLSKQDKNNMTKRINLMLNLFRLVEHEKVIGSKLSSGLQKRLSLACAIISDPKLLLLDEPTNGIDPTTQDLLIKVLAKLKSNGITIILNSHDLNFVSICADRVVIIDRGEIKYSEYMKNLSEEDLKNIYLEHTEINEDIYYDEL